MDYTDYEERETMDDTIDRYMAGEPDADFVEGTDTDSPFEENSRYGIMGEEEESQTYQHLNREDEYSKDAESSSYTANQEYRQVEQLEQDVVGNDLAGSSPKGLEAEQIAPAEAPPVQAQIDHTIEIVVTHSEAVADEISRRVQPTIQEAAEEIMQRVADQISDTIELISRERSVG